MLVFTIRKRQLGEKMNRLPFLWLLLGGSLGINSEAALPSLGSHDTQTSSRYTDSERLYSIQFPQRWKWQKELWRC